MTIKDALIRARGVLAAHDVEDTALESEVLMRHALKLDRTNLYTNLDIELSSEQENTFGHLVRRRLKGEPVAYITGHREFYGVDFYVNYHVLIPRPETELVVERAISLVQKYNLSTLADIGTGCGAIAISLALNLPQTEIYATDISPSALEVALANCQTHRVENRIRLLQGDMLDPLPEPVDLIIANLPYVRECDLPTNRSISEPSLALNGGSDGLEKIRQLCHQVRGKLRPGGHLLLEIGQGQKRKVVTLLRHLLPSAEIEVASDLAGIDRMINMHLTTTMVLKLDGVRSS